MTATSDARSRALARALREQVAGGARIEAWYDGGAVTVRGRRPNHVLHLLITLFSVGLWDLVWIALAILGGEQRSIISVDEGGEVTVEDV
ncbi:hypothetical protein [Miltoncostaea marina]|uniref:hypothetical protein n=1 Tax=Miltoncostaea marina TaxID=2843215 RepID=UPI001C3D4B8B|nr:hypothetical protein [Miltoncostaea marina]